MTRRAAFAGMAGMIVLGCAGMPGRRRRRERASNDLTIGRETWEDRVDGLDRSGVVVRPSNYDPAQKWPLVLVSHGQGGDAAVSIDRYGWGRGCEERGYVGLFPNTGGRFTEGEHDNTFFLRMIDRALGEMAIDQRRIYVVGFSGGCRRAYAFATQHSDRIAAVAGHSGTIGYEEEPAEAWDPRKAGISPISVLHIHGARDPKVSPRGSEVVHDDGRARHSVPMRAGLEAWASALGATFEPGAARPADLPPRCEYHEWRTGDGHLVAGILDPELDHEWASYSTGAIVDFFERTPPRPA